MPNDTDRYTWQAIALHWLLAILLTGLVALGLFIGKLPRGSTLKPVLLQLHESIGIIAGVFIAVRLWWRANHQPPPLTAALPAWQRHAAQFMHALLYALIVIMPVTGYASANFVKDPLLFFGWPVPQARGPDLPLAKLFENVHSAASNALIALVAAHVAIALKHWFVDRDGVFQRMLPSRRA